MKKKVLIIDDKNEFRTLLRFILSKKYEVHSAENGVKALKLLNKGYSPDAIVSDLMMPGMDGKGLINQLKAHQEFYNIPVIVLSSIDKSAWKADLLELGANDYLVKPFNPRELEMRIENLFQKVA
ncbi:MAG: response regulator transcription factor [Bacteroidales bacterium]|nr:response regulator transcription factor [Bacteroidales bacterium]